MTAGHLRGDSRQEDHRPREGRASKTLERLDMSAEDKNKLAVWKELLNDAGTVVTRAGSARGPGHHAGRDARRTSAMRRRRPGPTSSRPRSRHDLDGADMYSVIAVLSAACNYNPVIFLKYPANYVFTGLGINTESHSLSHRLDNASMTGTCLPNALDMLQTIDDVLRAEIRQPGRHARQHHEGRRATVLDNTAAVWFNEMSDGNRPQPEQPPDRSGGQLRRLLQDGLDRQRRYREHRARRR